MTTTYSETPTNAWEYGTNTSDVAIVCLVDDSGSMHGLINDTIGGFNGFKREQTSLPGNAYMSVSLFSSSTRILNPADRIQNIPDLNRYTYTALGSSTALFDAVAQTIQEVSKSRNLPKKVIFLLITDGLENSSHIFTKAETVAALIDEKKRQGWDFIFLGADPSAWSDSKSLGFTSFGIYDNTPAGIYKSYASASQNVSAMRTYGVSSATCNWNTASSVPNNGIPLVNPDDNK